MDNNTEKFREKLIQSLKGYQEIEDRRAAEYSVEFVKTGREESKNAAQIRIARSETYFHAIQLVETLPFVC